jgi:hypothetical protein
MYPGRVANDFNKLGPAQDGHSDKASADHSDKIRTNDEGLQGCRDTASETKAANVSDKRAAAEALAPATPVDLLDQAIRHARPFLHRSTPVGERLRCFWAGVVAARGLGASDVVEAEFLQLARDMGLFVDLGRHADEDLRHVIRCAMPNRNPFQ